MMLLTTVLKSSVGLTYVLVATGVGVFWVQHKEEQDWTLSLDRKGPRKWT